MKSRSSSVKWVFLGALAIASLTGCAGGEDEPAEEVSASEGDEAAEAPADDSANAASNAVPEGEENTAVAAEGESDLGAATNATGGESNFASGDIPNELLGNGAGDNTAAIPGAEDPNAAAGNMAGAEGTGMPTADSAMPASSGMAEAPSGDMKVYYVNVASASIRNSASAGGQSVGTVSKGEPVLVKIEGEWANVLNRGYIEVANLSMAPVGRDVGPKSWR